MNRMLISATQANEVRVALVKDQVLYDLDIERPGFEQKKANIYKGKISRIEPSLEAAFIEYGADRHGFLPFKEVARSYFQPEVANEPFGRVNIRSALREGQEVVVQIDKEERGHKGAALTTFISLAGSYLVLMPNNPRVGGISRRVEGKERDDLRGAMHDLSLPEGMGVIVRTAGVGRSLEELKWDLESLLKQWQAICDAANANPAPCLIYQEGDAVMRAIRDYLRQDTTEILVDTQELFEKTKNYIEQVKADFIDRVKLYENKVPLFSFCQIEKQIETAYQRTVHLPSGGAIVIDHTEALVSIDVNSAKATGGSDIEETAFNTNLEAAVEIARQLRLRDIGGLIVIDFIDMSQVRHQRDVSHCLREALECDRARVQVGQITRFGLLEMSRQRLRPHLSESIQVPCPRCDGQGTIRSIESLSSSIVRMLEEEASKENTAEIHAQMPIDLATFMLNEKRDSITDICTRQEVRIIIVPNQHLETPQYKIKSLRKNEVTKANESSYKLVDEPEAVMPERQRPQPVKETQKPVVPAMPIANNDDNLLTGVKRLFGKIFKKGEEPTEVSPQTAPLPSPSAETKPGGQFPRRFRGPHNNRGPGGHGPRRGGRRNDPRRGNRPPRQPGQPGQSVHNEHRKISHNIPPITDAYPEITAEKIEIPASTEDGNK